MHDFRSTYEMICNLREDTTEKKISVETAHQFGNFPNINYSNSTRSRVVPRQHFETKSFFVDLKGM